MRVGGGECGWAAGGRLKLPSGLLGGYMSTIICPVKPREPKRCLTNTGVNIILVVILHGWQKLALEKQTNQLSLLRQQCTGSVGVWLSAGPIK